jgi:dihydropteroate synthase
MNSLISLENPQQSNKFDSTLDCRGKQLDLHQIHIMGILNVTPDSFSDGGHYSAFDAALFRAERIISEGASIIDVGGESTKPGAKPVSVEEELDRVIPIIEALRDCPIPISVDTTKPEVMEAAVAAGAGMINDVNALQDAGSLQFAARTNVPICLMHRQGTPETMQHNPCYGNVVREVFDFLQHRVQACLSAGIAKQRLILDPGFGFGKTLAHNLSLLQSLKELTALGFPVLVGVSKKNMLGELLGKPLTNRLAGSLALAAWSVMQGVKILRVHDVDATRDVLKVITTVESNPKF